MKRNVYRTELLPGPLALFRFHPLPLQMPLDFDADANEEQLCQAGEDFGVANNKQSQIEKKVVKRSFALSFLQRYIF